ncbi:MAG: DNA pilot protein [Microvirus sp.]|nr:MAG: DNA pilot protein [Microvirus sp.]
MSFGALGVGEKLLDFGLQSAGTAFNWGLANKSANRYASKVRHLRRREYQDMMFSMKKAGLNPMLASGATPGHSAMQMAPVIQGQLPHASISGARQAETAASKAPSEIGKNIEQTSLANTEKGNLMAGAPNIPLQGDVMRSQVANNNAAAASALKQAGLIEANEAQTRKLTEKIQQEINATTGGNILTDPLGYNAHALEKGWEGLKDVGGYLNSAKDRLLEKMEKHAAEERAKYRGKTEGRGGKNTSGWRR